MVESGRHSPQEETLRRIAKAFGATQGIFERPTEDELARIQRNIELETRKSAFVEVSPMEGAADILSAAPTHALHTDMSAVVDDEALATAAELIDNFRDFMDIEDDMPMTQQVEIASALSALCHRLSELGYRCKLGHYRQMLRERGQADLILRVLVVSIRPVGDPAVQRLLVRLTGRWETHPDDRPSTSLELPVQRALSVS